MGQEGGAWWALGAVPVGVSHPWEVEGIAPRDRALGMVGRRASPMGREEPDHNRHRARWSGRGVVGIAPATGSYGWVLHPWDGRGVRWASRVATGLSVWWALGRCACWIRGWGGALGIGRRAHLSHQFIAPVKWKGSTVASMWFMDDVLVKRAQLVVDKLSIQVPLHHGPRDLTQRYVGGTTQRQDHQIPRRVFLSVFGDLLFFPCPVPVNNLVPMYAARVGAFVDIVHMPLLANDVLRPWKSVVREKRTRETFPHECQDASTRWAGELEGGRSFFELLRSQPRRVCQG